MPRKYDTDVVAKQAKEVCRQCKDLADVARALGMNRRTLEDCLTRTGLKRPLFPALLVASGADSMDDNASLMLQLDHWKRTAKRQEKQLLNRRWLADELAGMMAVRDSVPVPKMKPKGDTMQEQVAVLEYSDPHFGMYAPPGQLGDFGHYDSGMAERRTLHVFETFARLAKQQPFPVRTAKVYCLGDNVEHSHMRPGQAKQTDLHVVQQTLRAADAITAGLQLLSSEFEQVEAHCVPGNHGRTTQRAGENLPDETYDHLCYHLAARALSRQENLKIKIYTAWYFIDKIFSWNFLGLHCEDVMSYSGVPWYGIGRAVRSYYMMLGHTTMKELRALPQNKTMEVREMFDLLRFPDAVCIGHFHNRFMWDVMGVEVLANGSLSGVSLYSTKRLRKLSVPQQLMFFVHPDHGVAFRCPIELSGVG